MRVGPFPLHQRRTQPAEGGLCRPQITLILDFQPPRLWGVPSVVSKSASLWYFCYHSPGRLRQWCYFCVSAMGYPQHTYTHTLTLTHTHTPLSQWCRHPTQIKDRRPGWNERQITQGVSTPLENPGKQTSDYVVCALTMWYSRWENHFLIKVMETQSLWHLKLDCTKL